MVLNVEIHTKSGYRAGTLITLMECSVEKKVSEQSSLSAAVSIGVPNGVILKVK